MGKKLTPYEWAYKHTDKLLKKKEEISNSSSNQHIQKYLATIDYEPGYWTILKNISLAYSINPFGVILKKYNYINTVYIDLFSGCGVTPLKECTKTSTGEFPWTIGSPIISTLMTNYPFFKYYFGDINKESVSILKKIFQSIKTDLKTNINYEILTPDDANKNFSKILPKIKNQYVFAYIDPTGFQWNWNSMNTLIQLKKFDIFFNFQTRQVDRLHDRKIKTFFGPCEDIIINECKNCDDKLNEYIRQLEDRGCYVTSIRIGKDRTDQFYYHLLHISKKYTYKNIVEDLKRRIEAFDGNSIRKVWEDLSDVSRQQSFDIN